MHINDCELICLDGLLHKDMPVTENVKSNYSIKSSSSHPWFTDESLA